MVAFVKNAEGEKEGGRLVSCYKEAVGRCDWRKKSCVEILVLLLFRDAVVD